MREIQGPQAQGELSEKIVRAFNLMKVMEARHNDLETGGRHAKRDSGVHASLGR